MEKKEKIENQINELLERLKTLGSGGGEDSEALLGEVVKAFLQQFPEVANHESYHGEASTYTDSAYTFFGVLNSILCEYVEEKENVESTQAIIEWVNALYNKSGTPESVRNLLAIEFFEQSDSSEKYTDILGQILTGKAAEDFKTHKTA